MSCRVATFAEEKNTSVRHVATLTSVGSDITFLLRNERAKIVFAIPPTSAASERVFSLLEAMFGKDQDASLSDLIQGALMLRYNQRKVD